MPGKEGKTFIDTNILIYLSHDPEKEPKVVDALLEIPELIISTQVINEFCNVSLKRFKPAPARAGELVKGFSELYSIVSTNSGTTLKALLVHEKYKYSFYDSMVIAAALESGWIFLGYLSVSLLVKFRLLHSILSLTYRALKPICFRVFWPLFGVK